MGLRLWPDDFERKEHINKAERHFLRNSKKNLGHYDGHAVVGIRNPLGMSDPSSKIGMLILQDYGLVTFSMLSTPFSSENADAIIRYVQLVEDKIYERLLDSKILIARDGGNKVLKFPYRHIVMISDETTLTFKCPDDVRRKLNPYVTLRFFEPITYHKKVTKINELNLLGDIRKGYSKGFKRIEDIECTAILERLVPEYTVVMMDTENIIVPETQKTYSDRDYTITGKEVEYKTYCLDEYQVAQVNDMGKGHRVILANPGAGKSVLLLSKAFKYASLYKDKRILLTCYNDNLSDSYLFKKGCANFGDDRNLHILTLNKLVKKLLLECMGINLGNKFASEEDIENCVKYIKQGKINVRFKAIFIDEVQIFEPLYLELCYLLLEEGEDSLFLMAGDLNQTVRSQSRRGDAPWKKIGALSLDFTGRVKYIEKNYRNTKQIGEYLNRMLHYMNAQMESMNMVSIKEFEYNSFEMREVNSLALLIKTGISRMDITQRTIDALEEIHTKYNISYSDIAILFPYQGHDSVNYHFLEWMKRYLDKRGIEYSVIFREKGSSGKEKLSNSKGVILSTIDSSLGLDFKAVIISGLYPYNFLFSRGGKKEITSWKQIEALQGEERENVQVQMRKLYTGCSRARDVLYVISDLKPGSPMEDILLK